MIIDEKIKIKCDEITKTSVIEILVNSGQIEATKEPTIAIAQDQ